jgi:hypothetical protein
MEKWRYIFLNSALDEGEWSASCHDRFTHLFPLEWRGWVGPKVGLDAAE